MLPILVIASLSVISIVTAYFYVKTVYSYWKRKGLPFQSATFPFGNCQDSILQKKKSLIEELEHLYNSTSEPVIGFYMALKPVVLVRDPKIIKDICIKNFQSFDHRVLDGSFYVDPMAENIILQKGDKWKRVRTQLTPAFTSTKLKGMFDTIVEIL